MMELSIIIVNWNTEDLLRECLNSVLRRINDKLNFEILVVDNASADGSVAMMRDEFPDVRLIENKDNVGFARANNQAAAIANGQYT